MDKCSNDRLKGDPETPSQAELEDALAESEADVAAGRVVPLAPIIARMRADAARIRQQRTVASLKTPKPV